MVVEHYCSIHSICIMYILVDCLPYHRSLSMKTKEITNKSNPVYGHGYYLRYVGWDERWLVHIDFG